MPSLLVLLVRSSLVCLLSLFFINSYAQQQDIQSDLRIVDSLLIAKDGHKIHREYIYKNQPHSFKTCNPVSWLYGGLLFVYQNYISQHFSADCLYAPSCSEFSKRAVKKFGIIKGGLLTFDRLSRCNRIAATDLNPQALNRKNLRFDDDVDKYQ